MALRLGGKPRMPLDFGKIFLGSMTMLLSFHLTRVYACYACHMILQLLFLGLPAIIQQSVRIFVSHALLRITLSSRRRIKVKDPSTIRRVYSS